MHTDSFVLGLVAGVALLVLIDRLSEGPPSSVASRRRQRRAMRYAVEYDGQGEIAAIDRVPIAEAPA